MKNRVVLLILLALASGCSHSEKKVNNRISEVEFSQKHIPLFIGRENPGIITVKLEVTSAGEALKLKKTELEFSEGYDLKGIESVSVFYAKTDSNLYNKQPALATINKGTAIFKSNHELQEGTHYFSFGFGLNRQPGLLTRFQVKKVTFTFSNHSNIEVIPERLFTCRTAKVVRAAGQDNCDTYRIPGLVTTNSGTLIAVYDNRYNNSKDLQEDIDIGMSRSTDGGQSWEPMQVIMDMGEWGGRPERLNGTGDPCILYDHKTSTIWVAGLWVSGLSEKDMLWWASKPGMEPDETGQFMLVKSTDDGKTWSDPINITRQIKDPRWQLLFQGPGMGITLDDGTLVFPAQFKADTGIKALDGGRYTPHSTIVYSKDQGETWHIGSGAKANTTEAQVVQLEGGSLMLNMRDDLNRTVKDESNGRAVFVTSDMGESWKVHPSSNSVLPEPNCMASLIGTTVNFNGQKQQVLLFSNPNDKQSRVNMTIKASFDQGLSWPEEYHILLNENQSFGYSCLTMVDENTVGILYEGTKELYFQAIPLTDILKK